MLFLSGAQPDALPTPTEEDIRKRAEHEFACMVTSGDQKEYIRIHHLGPYVGDGAMCRYVESKVEEWKRGQASPG